MARNRWEINSISSHITIRTSSSIPTYRLLSLWISKRSWTSKDRGANGYRPMETLLRLAPALQTGQRTGFTNSVVDAGSTVSLALALPPLSLSIDLQAEEKFRNASLNRDAMQKKKKKEKSWATDSANLSFQPHPLLVHSPLFNLTLSSSNRFHSRMNLEETKILVDETEGLGWSPNRRHIFLSAFALHRSFHYPPPPPLRFHGLRFSPKFIHRSTSARGRSWNSNTFHRYYLY